MSDGPAQQDVYEYNRRPEVAAHIPQTATSALDIGRGMGGFGESLRATLGPTAHLVGIDPVESAIEAAGSAGFFDAVHTGYFRSGLPAGEGPFDLLCFNDVLEHTVDPWEILRQARERINPGGHVLACIPNVQYAPVIWNLVRGDFTYTSSANVALNSWTGPTCGSSLGAPWWACSNPADTRFSPAMGSTTSSAMSRGWDAATVAS